MRNVSDIICRENHKIHFVAQKFFFPRKSLLLRDNVEKYASARQATDENIMRRRKKCDWHTRQLNKNTDTPSEYLMLIAFPQQ